MKYGKIIDGKLVTGPLSVTNEIAAVFGFKPIIESSKPNDGCQYEKAYTEKTSCIEQTWAKTELQLRLEASEEAILELAEVIANG